MKRAIVLSGGGGKGAYQIGVWKALRKLHIKYHIVTGTSVGALNGAFMVQKNYYRALYTWNTIDFYQIFNDIEKIDDKKDVLAMYTKGVLSSGMEIKNLESLIQKNIDEKKFQKSSIDYGLITYNLTKKKPLAITKKKIKKGKLKDYLVASATCYPFFKKKRIDEQDFIDGGIYDNLPINLAISMGAEEVIAVDLKAPGLKQKVKNKEVKVITIKPQNQLSSFLSFNKEESKKNLAFGYNDTMKKFQKLEGKKYTFYKGTLDKNDHLYGELFVQNIEYIMKLDEKKKLKNIKLGFLFSKVWEDETYRKKAISDILEYLASTFSLPEEKIYKLSTFYKQLSKNLFLTKKKQSELCLQFYQKFLIFRGKNLDVPQIFLHSKDFAAALYLYTVNYGVLSDD